MKNKKLIGLLVPASILLTIAIFLFLTVVLPFSMEAYKESINESASETGSAVGGVAVAFGASFAFVIVVLFAIISGVAAIITIPLSLGLLKSSVKSIKIVGIVYSAVAGIIVITTIVKFIVWTLV